MSLGISRLHLLIADLLILETIFVVLALIPAVILYPALGLRSLLILPFGALGLALQTWIYSNSQADNPGILSKILVSSGFLAASWIWIFH